MKRNSFLNISFCSQFYNWHLSAYQFYFCFKMHGRNTLTCVALIIPFPFKNVRFGIQCFLIWVVVLYCIFISFVTIVKIKFIATDMKYVIFIEYIFSVFSWELQELEYIILSHCFDYHWFVNFPLCNYPHKSLRLVYYYYSFYLGDACNHLMLLTLSVDMGLKKCPKRNVQA